jgi:integrase
MAIRRIKVRRHWRYQARVAYRGARLSRLCATREEARQAEAELLHDLKYQAVQTETAATGPATMRALFEAYTADLAARGKGADTISRAVETAHVVERLVPAWLDQPVSTLTERDLFAFRQARDREGRKPSTINRDLTTLRAMLKLARPDFRFPAGVFFPEDSTRVRWLRPEEELLALEPMPSPFREIAKLAALTLMRLSEIRCLRREQVHLSQGVVLLPRTKTSARPVILSAEAQKLLRQQLERHAGPWVFPNREGRPYSRSWVGDVFRESARAAGLQDFHFHDLRHHGATMALNRGFSAPIVMALGGWKTERMMRRYAAVTDATLRAAAEAVSGAAPVVPWHAPVASTGQVPAR